MGVQLNIKSARVRALAKELAQVTGQSLTDAIAEALDEKLQRVRRPHGEDLITKWLAIGEDIKRRYPDMPGSADIDALLYDEDGLPK